MEPFIKLSRLSPLVVITEGKDSRASHAACLENQCSTSSRLIYRYSVISNVFSAVHPIYQSDILIFMFPLSSGVLYTTQKHLCVFSLQVMTS